MPRIAVEASYYTGAIGYAELPEDKTWNDVEDWYIKWDCLHVKFKGETDWREFDLNSYSADGTDWKRPIQATVYPCDQNGDMIYEIELDSLEN